MSKGPTLQIEPPPPRAGPLLGLRVVEFAGIGPGPHCAMLLADLGADVLRIDRPGGTSRPNPVVGRGRAAITVDLREPAGVVRSLELLDRADVLIEGFRPGVMERLGLGPTVVTARNPRLVYGRMTGWGQHGPLAKAAGHDINYIALTGALAAIGRPGAPATPPLNLVGDFGGGSLYLAFGIMAALWERTRSGRGQVIDAAIVDGTTSLMALFAGLVPSGALSLDRERSLLGGAAPYYRCYLCADGREVAIGAIEPQFYAELVALSGADPALIDQPAPADWAEAGRHMEALFATRTQHEWCEILEGTEACFAPVLTLAQAADHPHMTARASHVPRGGVLQPAPAPRFSRTPGIIPEDQDAAEMIARWSAGGI